MNSIKRSNDPVLDKIVKGYTPVGFIRDRILPKMQVSALKGDILSAGSEHIRIQNNVRVDRSGTPEMTFSISTATGWDIKSYGLKMLITKEDASRWNPQNESAGMQQVKNSFGTMLRNAQMLSAENALASVMQNAANYGASNKITLSGTSQFSDYTNSDPIGVFLTAQEAVYASSGLLPNKAVMSWDVFNRLRLHPKVLALIGTNSDKLTGISESQLATVMGVTEIIIGSAKKNTAAQGQARVLEPIWGKNIILTYVNSSPNPQIFEDSFGFSYQYQPVVADTYSVSDPKDSEVVRVTEWFDDVIHDFGAAYLIKDAVA